MIIVEMKDFSVDFFKIIKIHEKKIIDDNNKRK